MRVSGKVCDQIVWNNTTTSSTDESESSIFWKVVRAYHYRDPGYLTEWTLNWFCGKVTCDNYIG